MPTTFVWIIFFTLCLFVGCWRAYRLLIDHRRVVTIPNPLYRWESRRLSSWKYEPHASMAILVHTVGVGVLAVLAGLSAFKPPSFTNPWFSTDSTLTGLSWFIEIGSISLVGYLLGSLLAFPLASLDKQPVTCALGEQGLAYGRSLLPWTWFSHFTLDHASCLLTFYSAFAPDLPSFMVLLPGGLLAGEVEAALVKHLPHQSALARVAWYRSKHTLLPAMILLCTLFIILGWLATQTSLYLALFAIAVCVMLLSALGSQLLSWFGFGVLSPSRREPKVSSSAGYHP